MALKRRIREWRPELFHLEIGGGTVQLTHTDRTKGFKMAAVVSEDGTYRLSSTIYGHAGIYTDGNVLNGIINMLMQAYL